MKSNNLKIRIKLLESNLPIYKLSILLGYSPKYLGNLLTNELSDDLQEKICRYIDELPNGDAKAVRYAIARYTTDKRVEYLKENIEYYAESYAEKYAARVARQIDAREERMAHIREEWLNERY